MFDKECMIKIGDILKSGDVVTKVERNKYSTHTNNIFNVTLKREFEINYGRTAHYFTDKSYSPYDLSGVNIKDLKWS